MCGLTPLCQFSLDSVETSAEKARDAFADLENVEHVMELLQVGGWVGGPIPVTAASLADFSVLWSLGPISVSINHLLHRRVLRSGCLSCDLILCAAPPQTPAGVGGHDGAGEERGA